jgi:hypothetical protein
MTDDFVNIKIDVSEIVDLARKLGLEKAVSAGVQAAALHVKSVIAIYPPATGSNVAGPYPKRWYVRGKGSFWSLVGGGAHFRATSETLGRRWTIAKSKNGMGASVGNNASYARFVQDREKQAWFHTVHKWKTAQDVVESETPRVREIIEDSITAAIRKAGLS